MRKIIVLTAALGVAVFVYAQSKQIGSHQLMSHQLYPSVPIKNLQFAGNNQIAYTRGDTLFMGSVSSPRCQLTLPQLNKVLKASEMEALPQMPTLTFANEREFTFISGGRLMCYNIGKRTLTQLATPGRHANTDIAPFTHQCAYTEGDTLVVRSGDKEVRIHDGSRGVVYGKAVHRNEFGIEKGTFWSPQGNLLAFYRMDESMVADYPLVRTDRRIAAAEPFKYPMAGTKSHEVTVGIYNSITEQTLYLKTRKDTTLAERENYLTNLTWSPDERYIYIAKLNRQQDHLWLECYDIATGEKKATLFEEEDDHYVEPMHGLYFIPRHDDQFLWFSRRDGYDHLYRYNTQGQLLTQLTHGDFEVSDIIGFDERGKYVFVYANRESPIGRAAYKVDLETGEMTLMTPERGTHSVAVNKAGTMIIDRYSNSETPAVALIATTKGRHKKTLYRSADPLADYAVPTLTLGSIKAADGTTDLYYRLLTPPAMEPGKRYPTLVYVYGGPHSQLVTDTWMGGANLYFYFLAQQGYVVFTLDNRGTSNRGRAFESCTYRQLGTVELADQMEGVRFLKTLSYVDTTRMGVEGWSFGGFMTITMKLAHPEVFKVGCAGGPVIDWKWYEIMYGERYMDTPQENPEGYAKASLLSKADQLEGHLLVIHGAEDPVVMWQNSIEFIQSCIKAGKQVDYFVYPHHEHNVIGYDRLHLYQKMFEYYETFLK